MASRSLRVGTLGIMDASEGGTLSPRETPWPWQSRTGIRTLDVVLLPDTAVHTIEWLDDLQDAAGVPVLTANGVTIWEGLRLLGHPAAVARPAARSSTAALEARRRPGQWVAFGSGTDSRWSPP